MFTIIIHHIFSYGEGRVQGWIQSLPQGVLKTLQGVLKFFGALPHDHLAPSGSPDGPSGSRKKKHFLNGSAINVLTPPPSSLMAVGIRD